MHVKKNREISNSQTIMTDYDSEMSSFRNSALLLTAA
jgi:hypothetical protein